MIKWFVNLTQSRMTLEDNLHEGRQSRLDWPVNLFVRDCLE